MSCAAQQPEIMACMVIRKTRRTTSQFIHTKISNNLTGPDAHIHHARDVSASQTISRLALEYHYPAVATISIFSP